LGQRESSAHGEPLGGSGEKHALANTSDKHASACKPRSRPIVMTAAMVS
jgi:hypothetical protein